VRCFAGWWPRLSPADSLSLLSTLSTRETRAKAPGANSQPRRDGRKTRSPRPRRTSRFPPRRKEGRSGGLAGRSRDAWSEMKGGKATRGASLRRASGCLGLGQKRAVWELSGRLAAGFIALWRGGNAVSVAVKPLSSAGESSAVPRPGGESG